MDTISGSITKVTDHPHDLIEMGKKYKKTLAALKAAKKLIKTRHNKANGNMGKHFWEQYQETPQMQRINKAIKDGKTD